MNENEIGIIVDPAFYMHKKLGPVYWKVIEYLRASAPLRD